jgi:hypothetical protein
MMKNIYLTSILFVLCQTAFGQSDYLTTIKTPTNVSIEAIYRYEYSAYRLAQIEQDAADWIEDHDSGAEWVASASRTYNCHDYAWHYSDGGTKRWVNQKDRNGNPNISKYWSGSAPTYQTSAVSKAKKAFYPNGDHSAKVISSNLFESKWGAWPRFRHSPEDCPYAASNLQYYYIPISGNTTICSSESFSTLDISNASYNWSGSKVSISGTGSSVSATKTSNGTGWIKSQISSPYSGTTVEAEKNSFWLGPPLQPTITPLTYIYGGGEATFRAYLEESVASTYNWSVMGGSIIRGQGTEHLEVMVYPVTHLDLHVSAGNACGTGPLAFKSFDVSNGGGPASVDDFSVHPNPADHKFTVSLEGAKQTRNTKAFEYLLYNDRHQMVRRIKTADVSVEINAADLESGIYFLNIVAGDKILKRKIEIRH